MGWGNSISGSFGMGGQPQAGNRRDMFQTAQSGASTPGYQGGLNRMSAAGGAGMDRRELAQGMRPFSFNNGMQGQGQGQGGGAGAGMMNQAGGMAGAGMFDGARRALASGGAAPGFSGVAQNAVLRAGGAAEAPQTMTPTSAAPAASASEMPGSVAANMNVAGGPTGFNLDDLLSILSGRPAGSWNPERRSIVQTKPSVEEMASFARPQDATMTNSLRNIFRA